MSLKRIDKNNPIPPDDSLAIYSTETFVTISGLTSSINWNDTKQKIEGWGAAGTSFVTKDLRKIPDNTRKQILDLLFKADKDIGINILRNDINYRISPSNEPHADFPWDPAF